MSKIKAHILCPKCSARNNRKNKKCRKCGAPLKQKRILKTTLLILCILTAFFILLISIMPETDVETPAATPSSAVPATSSSALPSPSCTATPSSAEPDAEAFSVPAATDMVPQVTPSPTPVQTETPEPTATPTPIPTAQTASVSEPVHEKITGQPLPEINEESLSRVLIVSDSAKIYENADASSKLLGIIPKNTLLTYHNSDNEWVRIENAQGHIGFALLADVQLMTETEYVNFASQNSSLFVIVTAEYANVYRMPDEQSDLLGKMNKNSIMKIHFVENGWANVENNSGAIGYAKFESFRVLSDSEYKDLTKPKTSTTYVWVTSGGKSYHSSKECSNMGNPKRISLSNAKKTYTKCPKCW